MRATTKKLLLIFAGTLILGVLLHFLYGWLPNPLSAVLSPVQESLWEHVKIVYWPLLLAGFLVTGRRAGPSRAPWLLSAIVSSLAMLGVAYVYHILLWGESVVFDVGLYVVMIAVGFLLPRLFWPLADRPVWSQLTGLMACIFAVLVVWFTFYPPEHILFADLSQAARTFLTIPV